MKRYRLTTGLAIAGAAALAIPSIASAHALHSTCTTIDATEFPAGANTATIDVLVNGVPGGLATYSWTVPPPAPPFPVPYAGPVYQGDAVEVWGSFTSDYDQGRTLLFASSACGPVRPPVVVVPPGPPEPPVRIIDCDWLRQHKAGRNRLIKYRCVRKVPPPPRLTCADLKARGAGLMWLVRFNCQPKPPPFEPPVLG